MEDIIWQVLIYLKCREAGSISIVKKQKKQKTLQTVVNSCYKQIDPVGVKCCWNDSGKTGSQKNRKML